MTEIKDTDKLLETVFEIVMICPNEGQADYWHKMIADVTTNKVEKREVAK